MEDEEKRERERDRKTVSSVISGHAASVLCYCQPNSCKDDLVLKPVRCFFLMMESFVQPKKRKKA